MKQKAKQKAQRQTKKDKEALIDDARFLVVLRAVEVAMPQGTVTAKLRRLKKWLEARPLPAIVMRRKLSPLLERVGKAGTKQSAQMGSEEAHIGSFLIGFVLACDLMAESWIDRRLEPK